MRARSAYRQARGGHDDTDAARQLAVAVLVEGGRVTLWGFLYAVFKLILLVWILLLAIIVGLLLWAVIRSVIAYNRYQALHAERDDEPKDPPRPDLSLV